MKKFPFWGVLLEATHWKEKIPALEIGGARLVLIKRKLLEVCPWRRVAANIRGRKNIFLKQLPGKAFFFQDG
jgi:hypothetical protein